MNLINVIKISQLVISIVLVGFILIQSKGKGLASGVGDAFGMYRSRRGVEKLIFILTIVFSILIVVNSLLIIVLHN